MKLKALLLGASGFIGTKIWKELSGEYELYGTYGLRSKGKETEANLCYLDLEANNIDAILTRIEPQDVISSLGGQFQQQLGVHERVAAYLKGRPNGKMVYLSSANVFDNDTFKPHYETDPVNPMSDYGKFKAECERMLSSALGPQCAILRLPVVWGKECPRIKELEAQSRVNTVTNFFVNLTTDERVAQYVKFLCQNGGSGVFHAGTSDISDYYELQKKVCQILHIKEPEFEIETEEEKKYLALFSNREDGPNQLQTTIDKALMELR